MIPLKVYTRRQLTPLAIRLGCILLLYSVFRLLFYVANAEFFPNLCKEIFLHGIRFDLSVIVYINAPYILAILLPFSFVYKRIYQRICNIYFVAVNSFAVMLACVDIAYFPYVLKRSTADIFSYVNIGFDFETLLPLFFKQFWYLVLLLFVVIALLIMLVAYTSPVKPRFNLGLPIQTGSTCRNKRHEVEPRTNEKRFSPFGGWRAYLFYFLFYCTIIFFSVILMRGGFQLRPLTLVDTGKFAGVENAALVANTPFSIIFSIGKQAHIEKRYFSSLEEAEQYMSPIHNQIVARKGEQLPVKNVLVIVLEGFSQYAMRDTNEYLEGYQGFTPFLHGISQKAIAFNGFANGRRTIEALPAILGGIPVLLDKSYVEYSYSNNYVVSPVNILRRKGYNTAFFHGAKNNSMNIENYCYSIGFNEFFGKNEYPNSDDWDGAWGISDRSYLHYTAKVLDTIRQPFFAGILTLSTHHPFRLPKDAKGLDIKEGRHPMMACINYVDYALKEFFEVVSQSTWYDSTLFIITSDHTGEGTIPAGSDRYAMYQIPILFYHPLAICRDKSGEMMQQIDVMPSLFSYLGINTPLFSYGRNVFDTTTFPCAVNYLSTIYQFFTPDFALQFDGNNTIGLYRLPSGIAEGKNVMADYPAERQLLEQKLKALIESYTTRMSQNKLYIGEKKKK